MATRCVLVGYTLRTCTPVQRAPPCCPLSPGGRPNRPRDGLSALPDIPEACLEDLRRSVRSAVRASAKPVSPSQGRGGSSGVTSTSAGGAARRSSAVPLESFSGLPGFGTRVQRFPGRPRETGLGAAVRSDRLSRPVTGTGLKSFPIRWKIQDVQPETGSAVPGGGRESHPTFIAAPRHTVAPR